MTALLKDRKTDQFGTPDEVDPSLLDFPVAASAVIYGGAMVATNAAGDAVKVTASSALKVWGRCERQVDNTGGAAGALRVSVRQGVFFFTNGAGANAIGAGDVGKLCYASDDNTVNLTDGAGLWPAAGKIFGLNASGQVAVGLGFTSLYDLNDEIPSDGSGVRTVLARNVVVANVANLAAFTVAGNDGITNVAGDVVLLAAQTTAAQNGLYTVGTVGGGTAPLTRHDSMPAAGTFTADQLKVNIYAGTLFAHSEWKNVVAGTVDTDDPQFYPRCVTQSLALVAGTTTVTNVPVLSLTKTFIGLTRRIANTSTLTVGGYATTVAGANGVTAGKLGTASVIIEACVGAGTINNADISTLEVSIINY